MHTQVFHISSRPFSEMINKLIIRYRDKYMDQAAISGITRCLHCCMASKINLNAKSEAFEKTFRSNY